MKRTAFIILALAVLLVAGTAHAYAVYNHVNHAVCFQSKWDILIGACNFWVDADGHHNGAHGSGLKGNRAVWFKDSDHCRGSDYLDIPDGGYAKIYNDEIKIYKHDDHQVGSKSVSDCDCPDLGPNKKKK